MMALQSLVRGGENWSSVRFNERRCSHSRKGQRTQSCALCAVKGKVQEEVTRLLRDS